MEKNFDLSLYPHKYDLKVRSYELDFQGVVNNSVYFNYFELARIDYHKKLFTSDTESEDKNLLRKLNYFVVHNECDYFSPAFFDDELVVYTRISYIKKTSFCFEHLIFNKTQNCMIISGQGVIVNIDMKNKKSLDISGEFKKLVKAFDGNVNFTEGE